MFQSFLILLVATSLAPVHTLEAFLAGNLPVAKYGVAAAYDGQDSIVLIGGGETQGFSDQILKYNINTQVVQQIGNLPYPRFMGNVGVDQDGNVYYIGGRNRSSSYLDIVQISTSQPASIAVADIPRPLNQFAVVSDTTEGVIYTFGGHNISAPSSKIFKFNTNTKVMEDVGNLPETRHGSTAEFLNGFAYIIGGVCAHPTHILKFNPVTQKLTKLDLKLSLSLYLPSAVSDGKKIYAIGGYSKEGLHQITQLDFQNNSSQEISIRNFPKVLASIGAVYVPKQNAIYTFGGVTTNDEGKYGHPTDHIYKINLG